MLYSINQIQSKLAKNSDYKDKKNEIMQFFHINNIINNLNIQNVYTSNEHPPIFLEKNDIEKIFNIAQEKFGIFFNYPSLYEGQKPLVTLENNISSIKKYVINNMNDFNNVIEEHYQTSSYGLKQQNQEQINNEKKEKEAQELAKYIQDKKKQEWDKFNRASNLKRDFTNPKIVSIDFEFFLNKSSQSHTVTELGITIQENNQYQSQHYLIEETYQLKKNKNLQNSFHFGETKIVKMNEIIVILNEALQNSKYVLFHEQREDFEILKSLKIDINVDVIDTQLCYKHYFKEKENLANGKTLEYLLEFFKVEYKHLHNAGNDSYYTLILLKEMQNNLMKKEEKKLILKNKM